MYGLLRGRHRWLVYDYTDLRECIKIYVRTHTNYKPYVWHTFGRISNEFLFRKRSRAPSHPLPAIRPLTLNFEKRRGDLDNSTLIT